MTTKILELARSIDPATIAAIPRAPKPCLSKPGDGALEKVTLAVAEYRALFAPKSGDMKAIAAKHNTTASAMCTRMKREYRRNAA